MSEEKIDQQKPLDLVIDETREQIVQLLNESGLSIGIIAMLMRELSSDISNQARVQLQAFKQQKMKEDKADDKN